MMLAQCSPIIIAGALVFPPKMLGHDRRVRDPQPLDAPDPQLRVNHGLLVRAHPAGADQPVPGLYAFTSAKTRTRSTTLPGSGNRH